MTDSRSLAGTAAVWSSSPAKQSARVGVMALLPVFLLAAFTGCPASERSSTGGSSNSADGRPYDLGAVVKFGADGEGTAYATAGWSNPEPGHTWSDKTSALITLGIERIDQPLVLRMRMNGLTKAPELPFQPVELLANGIKVADWEVGEEAEYTAELPPAVVRAGGTLRLELKIPKATTPKQLGMGADERVLGISLHQLQIEKAAK